MKSGLKYAPLLEFAFFLSFHHFFFVLPTIKPLIKVGHGSSADEWQSPQWRNFSPTILNRRRSTHLTCNYFHFAAQFWYVTCQSGLPANGPTTFFVTYQAYLLCFPSVINFRFPSGANNKVDSSTESLCEEWYLFRPVLSLMASLKYWAGTCTYIPT